LISIERQDHPVSQVKPDKPDVKPILTSNRVSEGCGESGVSYSILPASALLTFRTKQEQCSLSVQLEGKMIRTVVEEAAALLSIALFVGMIAIWAEALSSGL
jgi:hypothetical protein